MATEVIMPKAGMAMESGTVIEWRKKVGDKIDTGEVLLEIETDKVTMEVEAEVTGYLLATLFGPGDVVPVTQTIGYIGTQGEAVPGGSRGSSAPSSAAAPATAPAERPTTTVATPVPSAFAPATPEPAPQSGPVTTRVPVAPVAPAGKVAATPAAKKTAQDQGVSLASVAPAPDGIVYKKNVLAAATSGQGTSSDVPSGRISSLARQEAQSGGVPSQALDGSGSGGRVLRSDVVEQGSGLLQILQGLGGFVAPAPYSLTLESGDTTEPLKGIRKVTAQRMMASHLTMPPTTLHREVKVNKLVTLKNELSNPTKGESFSINDLLLKAVAKSLADCPWMRVGLFGGEVIYRQRVNLGMAVATDKGLLVPVIPDADTLTLSGIRKKSRDLAQKSREGKLGLEEMQGAVFTVSNLGMYGITTFTPVINPPEAAILGVGTIRLTLARNEEGEIIDVSLVDLSITLDHRVIDGAQGALFLQTLAGYLEDPMQILV